MISNTSDNCAVFSMMFLKKSKSDFFGGDPELDPEDIVATLPSVCSNGASDELGDEFETTSILSSDWAASPPRRGLRLGATFFSESELSDTVITSFLGCGLPVRVGKIEFPRF